MIGSEDRFDAIVDIRSFARNVEIRGIVDQHVPALMLLAKAIHKVAHGRWRSQVKLHDLHIGVAKLLDDTFPGFPTALPAKSLAAARPIPALAPVMTTVLSFARLGISLFHSFDSLDYDCLVI
jgi:hypothetical protein